MAETNTSTQSFRWCPIRKFVSKYLLHNSMENFCIENNLVRLSAVPLP